MCSPLGTVVPKARSADLEAYRFLEERRADQGLKIALQYRDGAFEVHQRALRGMEDPQKIYFEKNWPAWLTGRIYGEDFEHE